MGTVRLLISTFGADEARSAIRGGADIVDIEDPKTDVGMYATGDISNFIYAVRQSEGTRVVRTSVNIGANMLLYSTTPIGGAIPRSVEDIRARAGQEALGIAAAMDVGDERPNIIKFGVDGIHRDQVRPFVRAIKRAIRESKRYQNHQVVGSFLPISLDLWKKRRDNPAVIDQLVRQGVFYFDPKGSIDLTKSSLSGDRIKELQARAGATTTMASLIEPPDPKSLGFTGDLMTDLKTYVDLLTHDDTETENLGADGVMIDTPVQAKAARICLLKDPSNTDPKASLQMEGLYEFDQIKQYVNYCDYKGVESWCAGSIQFAHAQRLGTLKNLDVMLCRGVVSVVAVNPFSAGSGDASASRTERRIDADLVAKMSEILRNAVPAA